MSKPIDGTLHFDPNCDDYIELGDQENLHSYFKGEMSEIVMWDRALTQIEIEKLRLITRK